MNRNRPFLKWAGNKYKVLPFILPLVGTPKRYCEPFGGSLAVALNVNATEYVLSDINQVLGGLYRVLTSEHSDEFIRTCEELFCVENNQKDKYNALRREFNASEDALNQARLFVYLNRHCFNGLARYNKRGEFNVPFGKYACPSCPSEAMRAFKAHFVAKKTTIMSTTAFDPELYKELGTNDVVYFDPPYVPLSTTANFTDYVGDGFPIQKHIELANLAEELSCRGIKVIVSNHDTPQARELYAHAEIHRLSVARTVAAAGASRKSVNEILVIFHKK